MLLERKVSDALTRPILARPPRGGRRSIMALCKLHIWHRLGTGNMQLGPCKAETTERLASTGHK